MLFLGTLVQSLTNKKNKLDSISIAILIFTLYSIHIHGG